MADQVADDDIYL